MNRKKMIFSLLVLFLAANLSFSEEEEKWEELIDLLDKAFNISLKITVQEGDNETAWTLDVSRITIIGRTVRVRLVGSNIIILANLTPYQDPEDKDKIDLVVQWQTWISSSGKGVVEYKPAMRTIPLNLGESALFFPLGSGEKDEDFNSFNIAIKLQINPYVSKKGKLN
jgi:hypothetical protein